MNQHHNNKSVGAEAFAIFEKKLALEIAYDNSQMRKNIVLRSDPIYAHINSVELRTLDGNIVIPFEGLDKATDVPGGRHIRCNRLPGPVYLNIPLSKLASGQETKLYVSKQSACNFPQVLSNPTISDIDTEKRCFNMRLLDDGGTVAIFGKVSNLSDDDFQSVVNDGEGPGGYNHMGCMLSTEPDIEFTSPNAVFTPTHVQILILNNGHPGLQKSLHLLRGRSNEEEHNNNEEVATIQQRNLVFSVTNDPHNLMLAETNLMLKLEQIKLDDLQDIIESIEISDGLGNSLSKLMNRGIRPEDGALTVPLFGSDTKFINLENLHEMKLSVSGVCLRKASGSFHPYSDSGMQFFQVYLEYDVGITVIGCLEMGQELTDRQLQTMTDIFFPRFIQNILEGRRTSIPFHNCPFTLSSVYFNDTWTEVLGKIHALLPRSILKF